MKKLPVGEAIILIESRTPAPRSPFWSWYNCSPFFLASTQVWLISWAAWPQKPTQTKQKNRSHPNLQHLILLSFCSIAARSSCVQMRTHAHY